MPSATTHPGFGVSTSPTQQELTRFARLVLSNAGITVGPNKIVRLVRRFTHRLPNASGYMFFLFLVSEVGMSAEQRAAAQQNPDIAHALAHFDPTPAIAIRNVMRQQGY